MRMAAAPYHPQKGHRRTCRWHCGSSGCSRGPVPCVDEGDGREPAPECDSSWPPTRLSGGSPGSWTSRDPGWGPAHHQAKALREIEDTRAWEGLCMRTVDG